MTEYEGHTPGPWRLFDDDGSDAHGRLIWGGATDARFLQGYPVAIVLPEGHESEFEANARLVADATTILAERDEARAQLYTARAATEVLSVGFNAACAQRDALAEALGALIDDTCSYICPSTGREGVPIPHSPRCIAARAALEKARGI